MNETMEIAMVMQFRQGSPEAVKYIYNKYFADLYVFAFKMTGDRHEAEDIAVTSFMKLWQLRERFETPANIKAFLYVTARNACLDHLRAYKRHLQSHLEIDYLKLHENNTRVDEHTHGQLLNELRQAIENLPQQCKLIFKLLFFEGHSTAAIAEQLGISPQTVLNQKTRALQLLRNALARIRLQD